MTPATLKLFRQTHHYIGVFIAPAVLFFSFTGFIQTFSLHEVTRGSSYVPPAILVQLGFIHKHAAVQPPEPPPAPKPANPKPAPPAEPAGKTPPANFHWPMKIFFGLVAIGLALSTVTGLVMAWKYNRNKPLVATVFLAGLLLPPLLLLI